MASLQQLRRLVPAALLAAAAVLGGSAVGDPATACAAPGEWDIGDYDSCMRAVHERKHKTSQEAVDDFRFCCDRSGGVWNAAEEICQAPPAEPADAPQQPTLPGVAPRPGEATQPPPPPPPPVRNPGVAPRPGVIGTFTPAPIG